MDTTATETAAETEERAGSEATDAAGQTDATATVSLSEHKSEVDRYRNQFGQEKKAREALEKRLQAIEDERKPEIERLTERAGKVETLEQQLTERDEQIETLTTALAAEVERQKKTLDASLRDLLPEGSPVAQLEWLGRAAKVKPAANGLPPSGGRAPGAGGKPEGPTQEQRQAHARQMGTHF